MKGKPDMKVNAAEVIGFVSDKMGISADDAQEALCITDRETVIELQPRSDKGRYKHLVTHDLDTAKVDLKKIAETLNIPQKDLHAYVEDDMIWIVYGENIAEGIVGEGPGAKFATADFYRQWYKEKIIKS